MGDLRHDPLSKTSPNATSCPNLQGGDVFRGLRGLEDLFHILLHSRPPNLPISKIRKMSKKERQGGGGDSLSGERAFASVPYSSA